MNTQRLKVFTDSKYVVDSVDKKWVFGWEKKGFKDKKESRFMEAFFKNIPQAKCKFSMD